MDIRKIIYQALQKRTWKHIYQRVIYGFDDGDTFSLDYTIAKFTLPRLKRFRQITIGHPPDIDMAEWGRILDDIEYFLEAIVDFGEHGIDDRYLNNKEKYLRGEEYWGKYFTHLWW